MRLLAKTLAHWMPAWLKLRACREVSADFAALLAEGLSQGEDGREAFREAAREAGRRAGRRLKSALRLMSSPEDAELAWRLMARSSGMRFSVTREKSRSVFAHHSCGVYEAGGRRLCEEFCLPMVEGLTEAVCPSCGVEVVRRAQGTRPCAKALVHGNPDV